MSDYELHRGGSKAAGSKLLLLLLPSIAFYFDTPFSAGAHMRKMHQELKKSVGPKQ